jgi:DsbC/DsbD-like thiol-disulfide interchange protein
MTIVSRSVAAALASVLSLAETASAGDASRWEESFHSRARLVSGGASAVGHWVGIEILLDPGFKTYWRDPGESGLPPRFDWTGSTNTGAIEMSWPAPTRAEDAGGIAHIYSDRVIFPTRVRAADPGRPIDLHLNLEYGVCKEICIPARAELELRLGDEDRRHRGAIDTARASVPRPQPLGSGEPLAIRSVRPVPGPVPTFDVEVSAPAGATPFLFAEVPEGWFVATSEADAQHGFKVTLDEQPKDAKGMVPLLLTLVAGGKAVETEVSLDASTVPR